MNREPEMSGTHDATKEKQWVALTSVLAAVFLTAIKLVAGLTTGSLGILAEAVHSGLDLVAATVTLFAVRVADRPPDAEHTYGHGKVENLSALFETVLLFVTCGWIIYEAFQRLFVKVVEVEASAWGFLVLAVSIVVDISRSRALSRAAKKHHSQALEADALHFSTDIWSSAVVIGGLVLVRLSETWGMGWLVKADAVAALAVAGIVIWISLQLGRRTLAGLIDEVPPGVRDEVVGAVRTVPGVLAVDKVRVRRSGPKAFADVAVTVSRDSGLEQAHDVAARVETAVRGHLPAADVTVHVDPGRPHDEGVFDTLRLLAARQGLTAHSMHISDVGRCRTLELHLEVGEGLRVEEAHAQVTAFETAVRQDVPGIDAVVSHIEPAGGDTELGQAEPGDQERVLAALQALQGETGMGLNPHEITVHRQRGELLVSLHCEVDGQTVIADAHTLTEAVERKLRRRLPDLGRVVIHIEPASKRAQ